MILTLTYFKDSPNPLRSSSFFILLCLLVYYALLAAELLGVLRETRYGAVDYAMCGMVLAGIMIYFATVGSGRISYIYIEKHEMYKYLDEPMFLLDEDGFILDTNPKGAQMLAEMGICDWQKGTTHIRQMEEDMAVRNTLNNLIHGDKDNENLFVVGEEFPRCYRKVIKPFYGSDGQKGSFLMLDEITNEVILMERLEATAGADSLTGLANRYRYDQLLRELDVDENLPLSVVMADVNKLKHINDTQGHAAGDSLLKGIADVLRDSCPVGCHVARIGGDEFVIILPRYGEAAVRLIMEKIKNSRIEGFGALEDLLSLGRSTKTVMDENLRELVHTADIEMYGQKSRHAAAGGKAMLNEVRIIVYSIIALLAVLGIVLTLKKQKAKKLRRYIVLLECMIMGWAVCLVLFNLSQTVEAAAYLYDLDMPFVAMCSYAAFMFVMNFYNIRAYSSLAMRLVLLVIPVITALVVALPGGNVFMRSEITVVSIDPAHVVETTSNLWYWVHVLYCYLLVMIVVIVSMVQYSKMPAACKGVSRLVVVSLLSVVAGNIIVLAFRKLPIDITLLGASICTLLLFRAVQNSSGLGFVIQARHEVLDEFNEAIMVVDNEGCVIYGNRTAEKLQRFLGAGVTQAEYEAVLRTMFGNAQKHEFVEDESGGTDYMLDTPQGKKTYNVREKHLMDRRGAALGMIVTIIEVTTLRQSIEKLEAEAGMDALTGLCNRASMERFKRDAEQKNEVPVGLIMVDLNDLKTVNDQLGHGQGDVYLRVVAENILASCPSSAWAGRIGGDEFMVIIPRYSMEQTAKLAATISLRVRTAGTQLFKASVAVGADVWDGTGTLEQAVDRADKKMYKNKRYIKDR